MGRQFVVRGLVGACLLVVLSVLGVAVKIGRDTSQYLQTISSQRDWQSVRETPANAVTAGGRASNGLEDSDAAEGGWSTN
ncbi:hypothetical protein GCM10028795_22200 [Lysobacter olei]